MPAHAGDDEHADEHDEDGLPNGDGQSVDAALPSAKHPSSSSFRTGPRPASPTKSKLDPKELKPNAHPYPIKMTATALLSRSNSASAPPRPPTPPSPAASPAREGRQPRECHGNRYSRSLSSSKDMLRRTGPARAAILPNVRANSLASTTPKRPTPAELAVHLENPVSREAGEWGARSGVSGRAFMRMSEEEMVSMAPPAHRYGTTFTAARFGFAFGEKLRGCGAVPNPAEVSSLPRLLDPCRDKTRSVLRMNPPPENALGVECEGSLWPFTPACRARRNALATARAVVRVRLVVWWQLGKRPARIIPP
ncbi:hypothetical protein FB451DRAFT_1521143 [Mycena latifolia]|nr:hypothetical protein FB451DRAFT_1521143 [Mycena latifolia]